MRLLLRCAVVFGLATSIGGCLIEPHCAALCAPAQFELKVVDGAGQPIVGARIVSASRRICEPGGSRCIVASNGDTTITADIPTVGLVELLVRSGSDDDDSCSCGNIISVTSSLGTFANDTLTITDPPNDHVPTPLPMACEDASEPLTDLSAQIAAIGDTEECGTVSAVAEDSLTVTLAAGDFTLPFDGPDLRNAFAEGDMACAVDEGTAISVRSVDGALATVVHSGDRYHREGEAGDGLVTVLGDPICESFAAAAPCGAGHGGARNLDRELTAWPDVASAGRTKIAPGESARVGAFTVTLVRARDVVAYGTCAMDPAYEHRWTVFRLPNRDVSTL